MQLSGVRPFVACLSVCPIIRPSQAAAAGLLLSARPAGDIDRLLPGAQQQRAAGECGQCHVVSVRKKLNTDLLCTVFELKRGQNTNPFKYNRKST